MSQSELELDLGFTRMNCTPEEVAGTLAALLREMQWVARKLRPDERFVLGRIMSAESGTLTVGEVFKGFARDSEEHKTLRRLRAAQFIRPAKHGHWEKGELIEVKPFARLMWDRVGEDGIFATDAGPGGDSGPEEPVVLAADEETPTPEAEQKPAGKPAKKPEKKPAEETDPEKLAAALWEDDDEVVLDLAQYEQEKE